MEIEFREEEEVVKAAARVAKKENDDCGERRERAQLLAAERLANRRVAELRRAAPLSEADEERIDWAAIERRAALHRDRERERLERINRLLDRAHELRAPGPPNAHRV